MIRKVARYDEDLLAVIYESLNEFKLPVKDKTILLKPNLVGLDQQGVMNTHPAVIAATRDSSRAFPITLGPYLFWNKSSTAIWHRTAPLFQRQNQRRDVSWP